MPTQPGRENQVSTNCIMWHIKMLVLTSAIIIRSQNSEILCLKKISLLQSSLVERFEAIIGTWSALTHTVGPILASMRYRCKGKTSSYSEKNVLASRNEIGGSQELQKLIIPKKSPIFEIFVTFLSFFRKISRINLIYQVQIYKELKSELKNIQFESGSSGLSMIQSDF